jgi:hypothetical protein
MPFYPKWKWVPAGIITHVPEMNHHGQVVQIKGIHVTLRHVQADMCLGVKHIVGHEQET